MRCGIFGGLRLRQQRASSPRPRPCTRSSSGVSTCGASCATKPMRAPRRMRIDALGLPTSSRISLSSVDLAGAVPADEPDLPALGDERGGVLKQRPAADAIGKVGNFEHNLSHCSMKGTETPTRRLAAHEFNLILIRKTMLRSPSTKSRRTANTGGLITRRQIGAWCYTAASSSHYPPSNGGHRPRRAQA